MISYENINLTINEKKILESLSGEIRKGEITAVMGMSGSGKSTFLQIISGRTAFKYDGKVLFDNQKINSADLIRKLIYIHQFDILPKYQTVYEYLTFIATLKGINISFVDRVIKELQLTDIKDGMIGDEHHHGISGGERKKFCIGIELLSNSNSEIMFLDEPTTGLDAFSSLKILEVIKNQDKTTILSIHQPNTDVFNMIDNLIVLDEGKIIYNDKTEKLTDYMRKFNIECPMYTNPADFLFSDVIPAKKFPNLINVHMTEKSLNANANEDEYTIDRSNDYNFGERNIGKQLNYSLKKKAFMLYEIALLMKRQFLEIIRDKYTLPLKVLDALLFVLLTGSIHYKDGLNKKNTPDRTISSFLFSTTKNLLWTPIYFCADFYFMDFNLLSREYRSQFYQLLSYFIAKLIVANNI